MIFLEFYSVLAGLALGSFANVCILRMPADESVRFPASHCPHCKHRLRVIDNIPVISYLTLQGRCRYCRAPISQQYILVETAMAALFLVNCMSGVFVPRILVLDILAFYLVTVSVIDYRHRIIPDELSLSLIVIGLCYSFWNPYFDGGPFWRLLQS